MDYRALPGDVTIVKPLQYFPLIFVTRASNVRCVAKKEVEGFRANT